MANVLLLVFMVVVIGYFVTHADFDRTNCGDDELECKLCPFPCEKCLKK